MHNALLINNIGFNKNYLQQKTQLKCKEFGKEVVQVNNNSEKKLQNTLDCMGAISFGSLQSSIRKISLKGLEKFITSELPLNNSIYQFMKRNPRGFYLEYGREVNKFLRKGTFEDLPMVDESMSPQLRKYFQSQIAEKKELNRTIVESLEVMDSKMTSRTTEPMTVYRDAPKQWMDKVKDGILTDSAYVSTSTERGASMEGIICNGADNFTYEIRLPKGTPFWDMTDTAEKEMLLPRNSKFKVIGPGVLELIL